MAEMIKFGEWPRLRMKSLFLCSYRTHKERREERRKNPVLSVSSTQRTFARIFSGCRGPKLALSDKSRFFSFFSPRFGARNSLSAFTTFVCPCVDALELTSSVKVNLLASSYVLHVIYAHDFKFDLRIDE